MTDRLSTLLICALVVCLLAPIHGCASSPEVGVRPDYRERQIPTIAVVPFYSTGNFGLSDDELMRVLELSEQAAIETLRSEGFEVIQPEAFRRHLAEEGVDNTFDDGVLLRSSLSNYFEPAEVDDRREALEVATVTELYDEGKLPADALLFGEVVYHTQTVCRVDPTEHNAQARVVYSDEEKTQKSEASPCLVSHFRAKLVDAPSGETMWFNRTLVQTHSGEPKDGDSYEHVAETVVHTITGEEGVDVFRGDEQQASHEKQREESSGK